MNELDAKRISILKSLSMIFFESLSRCECHQQQGFIIECRACQNNKETFQTVITKLAEQLEPDITKRNFLALYGLSPSAEDVFPIGVFQANSRETNEKM